MKLSRISNLTAVFLLVLTLGCGDDEIVPQDRYTYAITNDTDFALSIEVYQAADGARTNTFAIDPSTAFGQDTILSREWTVEEFLGGDSLIIRFSDGKSLTYKCLSNGAGCNVDRNIYRSFSRPSTASTAEIRDTFRAYQIGSEDYQRAE